MSVNPGPSFFLQNLMKTESRREPIEGFRRRRVQLQVEERVDQRAGFALGNLRQHVDYLCMPRWGARA
jgi:hypothetical protein